MSFNISTSYEEKVAAQALMAAICGTVNSLSTVWLFNRVVKAFNHSHFTIRVESYRIAPFSFFSILLAVRSWYQLYKPFLLPSDDASNKGKWVIYPTIILQTVLFSLVVGRELLKMPMYEVVAVLAFSILGAVTYLASEQTELDKVKRTEQASTLTGQNGILKQNQINKIGLVSYESYLQVVKSFKVHDRLDCTDEFLSYESFNEAKSVNTFLILLFEKLKGQKSVNQVVLDLPTQEVSEKIKCWNSFSKKIFPFTLLKIDVVENDVNPLIKCELKLTNRIQDDTLADFLIPDLLKAYHETISSIYQRIHYLTVYEQGRNQIYQLTNRLFEQKQDLIEYFLEGYLTDLKSFKESFVGKRKMEVTFLPDGFVFFMKFVFYFMDLKRKEYDEVRSDEMASYYPMALKFKFSPIPEERERLLVMYQNFIEKIRSA